MDPPDSSLISFIAIGRRDKTKGFILETSFCADEDMKNRFEDYARYKFRSVEVVSILMIIEPDM
jgi:hypothetical protein